jgi:hypothetical protein
VVPSAYDILDLEAVCEHFNRFFSMRVQRVSYSKLSVLVKANRPHLACICQEERMEFSTGDLLDRLSVEVLLVRSVLVLLLALNACRFVIHIEDLAVDCL